MLKSQQTTLRPLALAISSIALSMGLSGAVQAQGSMALEEIIVTAQKRMETTQETPLSITALSAASIQNRGIENSADLIGEIPGVGGFSAPGSRGASGLSMRGVSAGSPANLSLDPAVALYMDGVYVGKLVGSSMDVAEIERIETLRGPQGTLYGRNSTGGAVNIITQRPTGEFGLRATGTVGNYGLWGGKLNLDLPAIGEVGEGLGRIAASVGYQIRKRDDLYDNASPGQHDFDSIDREAWRLAVNWAPIDSVSVDYVYDHSELDEHNTLQRVVGLVPYGAEKTNRLDWMRGTLLAGAQAAAGAPLPNMDSRFTDRLIPSIQRTIQAYEHALARGEGSGRGYSDNAPFSKNDLDGHSLTVTWEAGELGVLGDVTFKSITAHRELEAYVYGDLEDFDSRLDAAGVGIMNDSLLGALLGLYTQPGSVLPGLGHGDAAQYIDNVWSAIDQIGAYHSNQNTTSKYKQFSQEFQMIGATERVDYALGLYWFDDESEYDRNAIFAAPLAGIPHEHYEITTEAWAVFGQATWRPPVLDDRLSLTAGLRYTEETKDISQVYGGISSPLTPLLGADYPAAAPYLALSPDRTFDDKQNFYNVSGNFTVAYQFTDSINAFLRYSTGYRSGGFNGEQFANSFQEETIEQWEIGVKSDWWDRRLRVNGSLWSYEYDDMQVSQIDASGTSVSTIIVNAGTAERWGGELEVTVAPIADLVLGLSYAYIHGDFEEFPATCASPTNCINTDNLAKRGASPGNQLNFTADYVFARTSFGDFTGYLQVNWQDEWIESSLWTGVANDSTGTAQPVVYQHQVMDQRTIVNARLNLENIRVGDGTLRFSLWGKNLTNDDYPDFAINFGSALGLVAEQYGEPRTYGLDVTYEY